MADRLSGDARDGDVQEDAAIADLRAAMASGTFVTAQPVCTRGTPHARSSCSTSRMPASDPGEGGMAVRRSCRALGVLRAVAAGLVLPLLVLPPLHAADPHATNRDVPVEVESAFRRMSDELVRRVEVAPRPDGGGGTPVAQQSAPAEVVFDEQWSVELPRFWTTLAPVDSHTFVRAHGLGAVARQSAEGETIWYRSAMSFHDDWGSDDAVRVPLLLIGTSPLDPFQWASEQVLAVGDVTGDGRPEVVVAHLMQTTHVAPAQAAVTVLDGATGTTMWSAPFQGLVTHLLAGEGVLVVAESLGPQAVHGGRTIAGEPDGTSRLHGFVMADQPGSGAVSLERRWSVDTGRPWARWLGLSWAGPRRAAVSWTGKPLGAPGAAGEVLLIDVEDGAPVWQVPTQGYPRQVLHDHTRDRVVVHEQADPLQPAAPAVSQIRLDYALIALRASDGQATARAEAHDSVLVSLVVGDATGDGNLEWVVGEVVYDPNLALSLLGVEPTVRTLTMGRVRALDGAQGQLLWTHATGPGTEDPDADETQELLHPYGLAVVGTTDAPAVAVASFVSGDTDLRLLSGRDGATLWSVPGDGFWPLDVLPVEVDGQAAVLGFTQRLAVRAYALGDGARVVSQPLLAESHAVASVPAGDGTADLVVGSLSGGVFRIPVSQAWGALPPVRWSVDVGGPVRRVEVGDLTGDGRLEVAVAATDAVVVLSAADGSELWRVAYPGGFPAGFVWTLSLADLDGDGALEVVVPTQTLDAFDGATGDALWRYEPEAAAVTHPEVGSVATAHFGNALHAEGLIAAQFLVRLRPPGVSGLAPRHHHFAVALDAVSGEVVWLVPRLEPQAVLRLWQNGQVLAGQGRAGGDALAWSFQAGHTATQDAGTYVVAYDATSGEQLWRHGPASIGHSTTLAHAGSFLQVAGSRLVRFDDQGWQQVDLPDTFSIDAAFAWTGERAVLLTSGIVLTANEPAEPWGAALPRLGTRHGFFGGRLHVADLSGDGRDEAVVVEDDIEGRIQVSALSGLSSSFAHDYPTGIEIVTLRER